MAKKKFNFTQEELQQRQIVSADICELDLDKIFDNKNSFDAVQALERFYDHVRSLHPTALEIYTKYEYSDWQETYEVRVSIRRSETDEELFSRLESEKARAEEKRQKQLRANERRRKREAALRKAEEQQRKDDYERYLELKKVFESGNDDSN